MGRLTNEERARRAAQAPPPGGAVQPDAIREPIKQMTGFATEQEMQAALPDNTMTAPDAEEKPRKPRRSKAEMEAQRAREGGSQTPDDPNMLDPRYKKAVEKMRSAGISTTVKSGFKTAAVVTGDQVWDLEKDEADDVDDFSYVVSKKYPIMDPTRHWLSMAIYFLALLGTLIFKRAAKANVASWMKTLTDWFSSEPEEKDAQEKENAKAASQ